MRAGWRSCWRTRWTVSEINPWLKTEEEEPAFPCVGCGACCSAVAHVPELKEKGWVLDNGVCMHLNQKTNQCAIYTQRPPVCEVMRMRPPLVSPSTWIQINLNVCDFLHRQRFEGAPLEKPGTTCKHCNPIPKKAIPEPGDDLA